MDLDSDLQTSQFDYIYSFSRGIRFFGSQDVILASRPSFCWKKLIKKTILFSFLFYWFTGLNTKVLKGTLLEVSRGPGGLGSSGRLVGRSCLSGSC